MRIEPSGLTPSSSSEKSSAAGTSSASGSSATGRSGGAAGSSDILPLPAQSGYLPSTELSNLTSIAKSDPEIRPDRIRDVAQKLNHGYYGTPHAHAKTAAAILDAVD
jgi:hypothetical protein